MSIEQNPELKFPCRPKNELASSEESANYIMKKHVLRARMHYDQCAQEEFGPGLSTAISSTAVSSTLGSSNRLLINSWILRLD